MNRNRIFERLEEYAHFSPYKWAKLSAGIVYKGNIIGIGTNSYKTHPFQAKYGRNEKSISIHAELSAIRDALRIMPLEYLRKTDLYVCRIKHSDRSGPYIRGMSKPCSGCMKAIIEFGIKKVYFTNEIGEIEKL